MKHSPTLQLLRDGVYILQRPEPDLRNILTVEKEVETASEDSGSPASQLRGDADGGGKGMLPWLTEWRLKLALASPERFQARHISLSSASTPICGAEQLRKLPCADGRQSPPPLSTQQSCVGP